MVMKFKVLLIQISVCENKPIYMKLAKKIISKTKTMLII